MGTQDRSVNTSLRRQIGYFCHLQVDEKHIGGVLVTNQIGVPVEFKYTEPVTATKLHKILYGTALERHVRETIIRNRLGGEVRSEPEFFIAPFDERDFLSTLAGREMMAIQRVNLAPGDSAGPFTRVREREALIGLEEGPTLRVAFSTSNDALQQSMVTWLQEIGRTMDILEPIERVQSALKVLCGEQKKG